MKTLKFKDSLAGDILAGTKTDTWRIFDDKDLQVGDELEFINSDTGESFGHAEILDIKEKNLADINADDYGSERKYQTLEERIESYKNFYGDKVNAETLVKIIQFKLK